MKKLNVSNDLRFWIESDIIFKCGFDSILILIRFSEFCLSDYPTSSIRVDDFAA